MGISCSASEGGIKWAGYTSASTAEGRRLCQRRDAVSARGDGESSAFFSFPTRAIAMNRWLRPRRTLKPPSPRLLSCGQWFHARARPSSTVDFVLGKLGASRAISSQVEPNSFIESTMPTGQRTAYEIY